ncbi:MAG TPA: transaldolase [Thermoanaerobaculia bacterium]|nr:transaldolase [Thermoanaerobaculia bacterium]
MKSNPLVELGRVGQSVWYDQMERSLITEGTLRRLIEEDDLRGLTSNPTIFDKAIGSTSQYTAALHRLAEEGRSRDEIYDALVLGDIADAADTFRPVYDRYEGGDGYVSLEVSPLLAHDTKGTIAEASRLHGKLGRPNVMIKIPATPEGIPAIEETTANGINVNITLIFSNHVYEEVIEAYLRGLERRAAAGEEIRNSASVASFFVSRIDTLVDRKLDERIAATEDGAMQTRLASLRGNVAIANAKMAYQMFRQRFESERFEALRKKGARVQRPLWASTGTKNPAYSDVLYIESLIAPDTVNTVPPQTYDAFRDHGIVRVTIEEKLDEAKRVLDQLEDAGISLDEVTEQLRRDGVDSFAKSFESLMGTIETRRQAEVVS